MFKKFYTITISQRLKFDQFPLISKVLNIKIILGQNVTGCQKYHVPPRKKKGDLNFSAFICNKYKIEVLVNVSNETELVLRFYSRLYWCQRAVNKKQIRD